MIYVKGTPKCWVTQDADGDTEPCFEFLEGELSIIYYIYVEEDEDEDSN